MRVETFLLEGVLVSDFILMGFCAHRPKLSSHLCCRLSLPVVICRPGATSRTCSIRLVLGSVCWQLASVYRLDTDLIPDDYSGLVAYFDGLLQVACIVTIIQRQP